MMSGLVSSSRGWYDEVQWGDTHRFECTALDDREKGPLDEIGQRNAQKSHEYKLDSQHAEDAGPE